MLRLITWRFWAALGVLLAADVGLGFWLHGDTAAETWIYKYGLLGATLIPLLFAAVYTTLGLLGGAAKWWQNDLGAGQVAAALTLVPLAGPFCWAIWFDNGKVAPPWLVWTEVSGAPLTALAWLALCWVFLRIHRDRNGRDTRPAP